MLAPRIPAVTLCILTLSATLAAQQQPPQTFRTGVTVVPLDVRVVDKKGKPITDLKQEDFTITEDGVPQKIVHFSFHAVTPITGKEVEAPLDFRKPLSDTLARQNRRIFLIVLGTGRQVGPAKGVEAAMKFVKERLLPQDQVAVLAYNRATDFTADHKKVIETLERYWEKHEWIESKMRHHFSGLAAAYASRETPPHIQKEVDAIFRVPGALTSRSLAGTGATDATQITDDTRRARDQIQRAEIAAERIANNMGTPFDASAVAEAGLHEMSFDEYVEKASDTEDDLAKLYAGIRYLRYLDGEKHLVFLTPNGLFLPRLENSNSIAALANDARVTVDILHTGGIAGGAPARTNVSRVSALEAANIGLESAMPSASAVGQQLFAIASSSQISNLTGGMTTAFGSGASAFTRLDEATRAQYLLGYSPSNGNWDGGYRRITVKVNRKDARVLYRHGYAARREITLLNRQQYLTYSRVAAAANAASDIDDLKFAVEATRFESGPDGQVLNVDIRIPPGALKLIRKDSWYVGKVETLYFCADRKQELVGEQWHTLDLNLTEDNYQKLQRDGVSYTVRIPLKGEPQYFKAILYDYTADLVGSVMRDFRKQ